MYFWNLLSKFDFKDVNLAKSWKKLQPYISEEPKCYIFSKSSQQLWLKWECSKVFQGRCPCQVWKEASSLFLLNPKVLHIFWYPLSNCDWVLFGNLSVLRWFWLLIHGFGCSPWFSLCTDHHIFTYFQSNICQPPDQEWMPKPESKKFAWNTANE